MEGKMAIVRPFKNFAFISITLAWMLKELVLAACVITKASFFLL
jgi:hypothetical protein